MRDRARDFEALLQGTHGDPFAVLGPHGNEVRVLAPGARTVTLLDAAGDRLAAAQPVYGDAIFEARLAAPQPYRLRIDWDGVIQITEDPYRFSLLLAEAEIERFAAGRHHELAGWLGAVPMRLGDVPGVRFAVWAPNAKRVSVVGHFNNWDGRRHPMRRRAAGLWEIFLPGLNVGEAYKYEILGPHGLLPQKADPIARQAEVPPATASIVAADFAPPPRRTPPGLDTPLLIYEVHATSWMRHLDGRSYNWAELAERLVPYAADLGFTHIELLPVMNHPFGGSWGYQPLSQFAPLPAMGKPEDFAAFVSACHEAGLGVILDWVPAHFPDDPHGLAHFDGTHLYEHQDPREGRHPDWNSLIYNLGRNEVREFLIASALFWLEQYSVDGLRVDAVASMLYRDYSRAPGQWVPNRHGGRENLEAVSFLQELSEVIAARRPGALLVAEESTAWPGVTQKAAQGGLGFTHKWNMGWMHDTLRYVQQDPIHRRYHHDQMTFGLIYAFSERFILPISHDELVHGKGSLLGRMPGDEWQRFATLRAYLTFMWTHPGKKLLFMGSEFGQPGEWSHESEVPWHLLQYETHRGVQGLVRQLNALLKREPALYERDFTPSGFQWLVGDDREQSVFAYARFADQGPPLLVVCNFTPSVRDGYRIGVPEMSSWQEIFNSDATGFGGSGVGNGGIRSAEPEPSHGRPGSLRLTLPPLASIILRRA
ncbi:MAG TPA: 1,4-alpha-glucan branching protein GlgB [Acidocella sp.]|jgi:1,4-alpha-glucan branching enzyme|nr:1,4-alpha-glucan branching protein GlgB [Acidocella sp.]